MNMFCIVFFCTALKIYTITVSLEEQLSIASY